MLHQDDDLWATVSSNRAETTMSTTLRCFRVRRLALVGSSHAGSRVLITEAQQLTAGNGYRRRNLAG